MATAAMSFGDEAWKHRGHADLAVPYHPCSPRSCGGHHPPRPPPPPPPECPAPFAPSELLFEHLQQDLARIEADGCNNGTRVMQLRHDLGLFMEQFKIFKAAVETRLALLEMATASKLKPQRSA